MPFYRQLGTIPFKRHTALRHEPGYRSEGIRYEEVVTTAGFGRAYSIVYHLRPPTRVRKVEAAGDHPVETVAQPVLRHHHLKSGAMPRTGDPVTGRMALLSNADVTVAR
jgi:homogentisate 1,2-dioxygenase